MLPRKFGQRCLMQRLRGSENSFGGGRILMHDTGLVEQLVTATDAVASV